MGLLKKLGQWTFQYLFTSAVFALSFNVLAEEALNKVDSEALENTIKMMQSPQGRQKAINENGSRAKKADQMAQDLMGSDANVQEIYKAAAEIFRKVASDSDGDMEKMMEIMGNAQKNPEDFYNSLTPDHKQMIKSLGEKAKELQQLNQQ